MNRSWSHFVLAAIMMTVTTMATGTLREYRGLYTQERLANVIANVRKCDWTEKVRDEAVAKAAPWISKSDETLWSMVPGQDLPRCIDVIYNRLQTQRQLLACPECGEKILAYGAYPFILDFVHHPWKIICPSGAGGVGMRVAAG
jgi:hypothetical protein